jgi:hypothetical protein
MEVTVKTLTGKSFSVHICPSETIAAGWWFGTVFFHIPSGFVVSFPIKNGDFP